jgi:hypothetical protein
MGLRLGSRGVGDGFDVKRRPGMDLKYRPSIGRDRIEEQGLTGHRTSCKRQPKPCKL